MRSIISLYSWLAFSLYTTCTFVVILIYGSILKVFFPKKLANNLHYLACGWSRGVMSLVPGWKYEIKGKENLPKVDGSPVVLVANHQSAVDILAIMALSAQFRWLSKASVFHLPIIGIVMKWIGYIPVERGSVNSHKEALYKCAQCLKRGTSVFFFPEGTRSKDGKVKSFKVGAFKLSKEENIPVVPIILDGTMNLLEKNSFHPAAAKTQIRILPGQYINPGEEIECFAERIRRVIIEKMKPL